MTAYNDLSKRLQDEAVGKAGIDINMTMSKEDLELSEEYVKLMKEVKDYIKIAINLSKKGEQKYGKEYKDLIEGLFSIEICKKDGTPLLFYNHGDNNEIVIIKKKDSNQISFAADIKYDGAEYNSYSVEDYIKMDNIRKYYGDEKIFDIIYEGAYEMSDEFYEKYTGPDNVDDIQLSKYIELREELTKEAILGYALMGIDLKEKIVSEKYSKVMSELNDYIKVAIQLSKQGEEKYGIEYKEIIEQLLQIAICKKNGRPLLIYDKGDAREIIIIKKENTDEILFTTKLLYTDKDESSYNNYSAEDYINMDNIHKIYDKKEIFRIINESAYERTDEFEKQFKKVDTGQIGLNPFYVSCAYGNSK